MAKKSTVKETSEASPEKKTAKKTLVGAEVKPKASKKATSDETKPAKVAKPRKKASAEPAAPEAPASSPEVIEEEIRVAAYYRWVERGMCDGCHEEDWIEAEKQIRR
jgi:hypothetical protein